MTFCSNHARGHERCNAQCNYCYHYEHGLVEPTSPVPVTHVAHIGKYGVYISDVDITDTRYMRDKYSAFVVLAANVIRE